MENAFEHLGNSINRLESKMDIQYKTERWTVTVFKFV